MRDHEGEVKINLILSSATEILALRYAEPGGPNTQYYLEGARRRCGGSVLASEPLDDGLGWREIGLGTMVPVDAMGGRTSSLSLDEMRLSGPPSTPWDRSMSLKRAGQIRPDS